MKDEGCFELIINIITWICLIWFLNSLNNDVKEQQKELNSLKYRLDLIEGIKQKQHTYPKDTSYYEVQYYSPKDTIAKYEY